MRRREYISPSAYKIFKTDLEQFYIQYLADEKTEREPQTSAMSIGSSFDAYVKAYLHKVIYGQQGDPRFEFEPLFEAQVEPHNRDWARKHGAYVFDCYKTSGALADLLTELETAMEPPSFEISPLLSFDILTSRAKHFRLPIIEIDVYGHVATSQQRPGHRKHIETKHMGSFKVGGA